MNSTGLLFLIAFLATSEALLCKFCEGVSNNDDCLESHECKGEENACEVTVRKNDGRRDIHKRCKNAEACNSNFAHLQNLNSLALRDCVNDESRRECRCCCQTDFCNEQLNCQDGASVNVTTTPAPSAICPLLDHPQNGMTRCMSNHSRYPTVTFCQFSCNKGYSLMGNRRSTCLNVANGTYEPRFDNKVPVCIRNIAKCELMNPFLFGRIECSRFKKPLMFQIPDSKAVDVGTFCRFECDLGYMRDQPYPSVICITLRNEITRFNRSIPTCKPIICPEVRSLHNGNFSCTNGYQINSTCNFRCNEGYMLVPANHAQVQCGNSANWSSSIPRCFPFCRKVQLLNRGNVTCTKRNEYNSVCTFSCEDNYRLYPPITEMKCGDDGSWSSSSPCCCISTSCPPHAFIDLIIALDSSSSIRQQNWDIIKIAVARLISKFKIGDDATRVGIFRYNRNVDTATEIYLNEYNDTEALQEAIDNLAYNGGGTFTGRALRHARNVMFAVENGNRPQAPDMIIVITDGRAQDDVSAASEALRANGVTTYAVGVVPPFPGTLDFGQLLDISGTVDHLIIVEFGFEALSDILNTAFIRRVCSHVVQTCASRTNRALNINETYCT